MRAQRLKPCSNASIKVKNYSLFINPSATTNSANYGPVWNTLKKMGQAVNVSLFWIPRFGKKWKTPKNGTSIRFAIPNH